MPHTLPSTTVLVTGFEPFASFDVNPSWEAAREAGRRFPEMVRAVRLPVDYFESRSRLIAALEELRPGACLCMGLAPVDEFRMEQVARKPKEFGAIAGLPLLTGTWPWAGTQSALGSLTVPHRFSSDAGQYVCESTYWSLLNYTSRERPQMPAGFLHVPAVSGQFPLARTIEAVGAVIAAYVSECAARSQRD